MTETRTRTEETSATTGPPTIGTTAPTIVEPAAPSVEAGRVLLDRLVGRVDPVAVAAGRDAALGGDVAGLARLLAQLVVAERVPLLPDEHEWFAVVVRDDLPDAVDLAPGPVTDLPMPAVVCRRPTDPPDETVGRVLDAVRGVEGVVGVWHATASSAWAAAWPPPQPFVVIEADSLDAADGVAHLVQAALRPGVGPVPHVAVVGPDGPETPHVAAAQLEGALLWAASPDPGIRLAEPFPGGPPAAGEAPADPEPPHDLDEERWEAVLEYLTTADVVLRADGRGQDLVTGDDDVVPVDLRSDGTWVWSDASSYYLLRHGLPLEEEFLAHLLAQDGEPPALDGVGHHRVLELLGTHPADESD